MTDVEPCFTVSHALNCRKGGLVVQLHNEVHDTIYDLAAMAWRQTTKEPVIGESLENSSGALLWADIRVRGVWRTQATALVDVRVIDTNAKSYVGCTPQSVLEKAEKEKKSKYLNTCEEKHVSFTPLCFFCGWPDRQ